MEEWYVVITLPYDSQFLPMCTQVNRVFEHRLVMAQHLGRCLESWEVVHHKNGIKHDNRIENLELLPHNAKNVSYWRIEKRLKGLERENQILRERLTLLEAEVELLKHGNPVPSRE